MPKFFCFVFPPWVSARSDFVCLFVCLFVFVNKSDSLTKTKQQTLPDPVKIVCYEHLFKKKKKYISKQTKRETSTENRGNKGLKTTATTTTDNTEKTF